MTYRRLLIAACLAFAAPLAQGCDDGTEPTGGCTPATETCDGKDNDCDGQVDEDVKNACGGCGSLMGEPDSACENCGTWKCEGDKVRCVPAITVPGTGCTGTNGCTGTYQCGQDGQVKCAAPEKNACGKCGGVPVSGVGEDCTSDEGCEGVKKCGANNESVVCEAPRKNACGLCGGPSVTGLDDDCTAENGCAGKKACSPAGDAAICKATVTKNACGVCGGPTVTGLDQACASGDGCQGKMVCNQTGTGVVCNAGAKNDCGVCGGPELADWGLPCQNAEGCSGKFACDTNGTGLVCDAPKKNECGLCGGAALANINKDCISGACEGKYVCNQAGDALVCSAPGTNNCGACGKPDVTGLDQDCTTASGCPGKTACDPAGTGTICKGAGKNECGVCGGAAVTGLGADCTNAFGCAGKMVCNLSGQAAICDPKVSCSSSAHLVISEVCGNNNVLDPITLQYNQTDEFVELYNPTTATLDLAGVTLWYRPATSTALPNRLLTFPAGTKLPARRYLLLGKKGGANSTGYIGPPAADFLYSGAGSDLAATKSGGQVWLTASDMAPELVTEPSVVDMVGWGNAASFEGTGAVLKTGKDGAALERKANAASTGWDPGTGTHGTMGPGGADELKGNSQDTNDNKADFVHRELRDPQNSQSPAENP